MSNYGLNQQTGSPQRRQEALLAHETGGRTAERIQKNRESSYPEEGLSDLEKINFNLQEISEQFNAFLKDAYIGDTLRYTFSNLGQLFNRVAEMSEAGTLKDAHKGSILVNKSDIQNAKLALTELRLLTEAYRIALTGDKKCCRISAGQKEILSLNYDLGVEEMAGEKMHLSAFWQCDRKSIEFSILGNKPGAEKTERVISGRVDLHPLGTTEENIPHINVDGQHISPATDHLGIGGHFTQHLEGLEKTQFSELQNNVLNHMAIILERATQQVIA
jgi:hypothetical protein